MKSTSIPENYQDRLRRLREKRGWSQGKLAELLGVSFATVNRWENGHSHPNKMAWRQFLLLENERSDISDSLNPLNIISPQITESNHHAGMPIINPPHIDFTSSPEKVRAAVEAERLTFGHLFNPAFATETSKIDPLPHQRIAVYDCLLPAPRLKFLLADDAGAGKTIMAGLYIREMLARRLIRRVLIIPPAGLLGNWKREMQVLFNLTFKVVTGADSRTANPFTGPDSDLVIVSIDTISGGKTFERLREKDVEPYDLVIFDEAHKLSADRSPDLTVRKIDRYRLAEAISGASTDPKWLLPWNCRHLLLLTATPHMGKDYPYYSLWRLLEPDILPTFDAFEAYPRELRAKHFLRRTKEEMVYFDGTPIYPTRESSTMSYDLSTGEQRLYDETTSYIQTFYNRARILNRSAARLVMTIFQRRLASSTYALLRSLEKRLKKLDGIIEDIQSGRTTTEQLLAQQRDLDDVVKDVLDEMTGDEEETSDGLEENEIGEDKAMVGVVAVSLSELEAERKQVDGILVLAREVYAAGEESKFDKLREVLQDERFKDEKILIFSEHRDTLSFLVQRLEGLGFAGKIAHIHGGMNYKEREVQVEIFRRPADRGGASFMIATDAAGEGINLQFCWLMVNYDIPWNPARIEQRFGRIHRYLQKHDPVLLFNLVAAKTREGKVLKRLLDKLEVIRKELNSDKVFDVIGQQFVDVSLKDLILQAVMDNKEDESIERIEGILTPEQAKARMEQLEKLLGTGGDVKKHLPDQREKAEREELRRLLPGYVRRFIEMSSPLLNIGIDGDLEGEFFLKPLKTGALDSLLPALDSYEPEKRARMTVYKPAPDSKVIYLHPGEPIFDSFAALVSSRFRSAALRGSVFIDPYAERSYFLHLALVSVHRKADPAMPYAFGHEELIERRLVALKHEQDGLVVECPVEHLLLLKGAHGLPPSNVGFAATVNSSRDLAMSFTSDFIAKPIADAARNQLLDTLPGCIEFLERGCAYEVAELAASRTKLAAKARDGNPKAKEQLTKIKEKQRKVEERKIQAIEILKREPELIEPDAVIPVAHVLVVPTGDSEEKRRIDREVEKIAVQVARGYEESRGCVVRDVSTPELARAAFLGDWPGFDLLSKHPSGEDRAIEVKGRAAVGDIELSENEWAKACNLRNRYWLYVVYNCASNTPALYRIQDPFGKLIVKAKGGVVIVEREILESSEN